MRTNWKFILLSIVLLLSLLVNWRLLQVNKSLVERSPILLRGEKLNNFSLINENGDLIVVDKPGNPFHLFFIFSRPCSACNQNIAFWQRLSKIYQDRVTCSGIIVGDFIELGQMSPKLQNKFPLFVPKDQKSFIRQFHLQQKMAQTILVKNNRVVFVKIGDIDSEDIDVLHNIIKEKK